MNRPPPSRLSARYGPWALVTGASSGIGRAFAEALAARGLDVALSARREGELHALARTLHERHGTATRVLALDLGERDAAAELLERTADLDVGLLVASAGFGAVGPLCADDVARHADMVDVNCRALLVLSHGIGRRLITRGRGGLVLLSSLAAFQGAPFAANYAATKAYVQALAEGLGRELRPRGVDVLACAPGPVATGFAARAGMRMDRATTPETVAAATLRRLGRGGTVRPGALAKLLGAALSLLPRPLRVRALGRSMAGMVDPAR